MHKNPINIDCPMCHHTFETDRDFAIKNKLVFCTTCCKSFEVQIQDKSEVSDWYRKYIENNPMKENESGDLAIDIPSEVVDSELLEEEDSSLNIDHWDTFDIPF